MARTPKQAGFTVVEILLVLILVAVVAFSGYYVWHSQQTNDKTQNTSANASSSKRANMASSPGVSSQKYLTFKEWGVRIPYGTDYNFVSSTTVNFAEDGPARDPNFVGISTDTLTAADSGCTAQNAALGMIQRAKPSDLVGDDGSTASQVAAAKTLPFAHIGKYYYFYEGPQSACQQDFNDQSINKMEQAQQNEIKALVPLAEATN